MLIYDEECYPWNYFNTKISAIFTFLEEIAVRPLEVNSNLLYCSCVIPHKLDMWHDPICGISPVTTVVFFSRIVGCFRVHSNGD